MAARKGHKPTLETVVLLRAVEEHGPEWPKMFGEWEITAVNEAVDRAQLAGLLNGGFTITPAGLAELRAAEDLSRPVPAG